MMSLGFFTKEGWSSSASQATDDFGVIEDIETDHLGMELHVGLESPAAVPRRWAWIEAARFIATNSCLRLASAIAVTTPPEYSCLISEMRSPSR